MTGLIGKEFLKKTQLRNLGPAGRERGLPKPALELEYDQTAAVHDLPTPSEIRVDSVDVREAIEERMSIRDYADEPIHLEKLSYLLWCTQGLKRLIPDIVALRNVPSAGGRHCLETYLLVNKVEGLQPALYRYLALENQLIKTKESGELARQFAAACDDQEQVVTSAVTFFWAAVEPRMTWVYGERGYRYMLLDAGHVCQNLYLAGESIDCGVCALAHFHDDQLNQLIGLDGEEQFVVYAATVGRKGEEHS